MREIITVDQLNFNFLGNIFGKKGVRLTDQGLLIDTKKGLTELISFAEVKRFAYIEEGFFGATLFVHNNQSLQEHKFLSKTNSTAFLESINRKIAHSLQPHLLNLIEDFNLRVLSNYPRDSKMHQIRAIADELATFYKDVKVTYAVKSVDIDLGDFSYAA